MTSTPRAADQSTTLPDATASHEHASPASSAPSSAGSSRSVPPSAGAQAVEGLRRQYGGAALAGTLGCSDSILRAIAKCERRPGPKLRAKLAALGVALGSWEAPPVAAGAPPAAPAPAPPAAAPATALADAVGTTLAECEANVLRLRRQAEAAAMDTLCSHRDRATVGAALNHAIRHLSKLRGEDELTEARITKSPAFARVFEVIREAAKPYPAACAAIAAAVAKLGGTP
jgi:hypothetical protein